MESSQLASCLAVVLLDRWITYISGRYIQFSKKPDVKKFYSLLLCTSK